MIIKKYIPISAGLSFRQNELTRKESMASEMTNADYSEHKSLTKRVGLHPIKWGHFYESHCIEALHDSDILNSGPRQTEINIKNILVGRGCWSTVKVLSDVQEGALVRNVGKWASIIPSDGNSAFAVALRGPRTFYRNILLDGTQPIPFDDRGPLGNTARQNIVPTAHRAFRGITYLSTEDRRLHRTDKKDILPVGVEGYERKEGAVKKLSVIRMNSPVIQTTWTSYPETTGFPGPGGGNADLKGDGPGGWAIQGGRSRGELIQFPAPEWDLIQKSIRPTGGNVPIQSKNISPDYPTVYFTVSLNTNKEPLENLLEVAGEPVDSYIQVGQAGFCPGGAFADRVSSGILIGLSMAKTSSYRNGEEDFFPFKGIIPSRETEDEQLTYIDQNNIPNTANRIKEGWETHIIKAVANGVGEYSFQLLQSNIARGRDQMPAYFHTSVIAANRGPDATHPVTLFVDGQGSAEESNQVTDPKMQRDNVVAKKALLSVNEKDLFYIASFHNPGVWLNPDGTNISSRTEQEREDTFGNIVFREALWDLGNTNTPVGVADANFVQIWDKLKEKYNIEDMLNSFKRASEFDTRDEACTEWTETLSTQGFNKAILIRGNSDVPTDVIEIEETQDTSYSIQNNFRAEEGPTQTARAPRLHVAPGDTTHLAFRLRYTDKSLRKNVSYSLPYEESLRHYFGTNTDAKDGFEGQYPGGRTASITLNEIKLSNIEWAKDFLAPILVRLRNEVEADLQDEGYDFRPGNKDQPWTDQEKADKIEEVYKERERRLLEKLKEQIVVEVYQTLPNDQVHFFVGEFLPKLDLKEFLSTDFGTPSRIVNQYNYFFDKDPLRNITIPMLGIDATSEELSKGRDALVAGGDFDYVTALKAVVPPKAGLIEEWRNLLVLSDIENQPNAIRIMDGDNLDGFPFSKELVIDNAFGLPITSIRELNGVLYVFTEGTIHVVSGNPWVEPLVSARGAAVRVDKVLEEGIGCVSQTAITEKDKMLWFVGNTSIYTLGREGVRDMAEELEPLIKGLDKSNVHAFTWKAGERILFNFANDNKTLVYHITVRQWTIWEDVNFDGGIIERDNKVYLLDKKLGQIRTFADLGTKEAHKDIVKTVGVSPDAQAVRTTVLGVPNTEIPDTYEVSFLDDSKKDVKFTYKMHWEHLDTPTAFKKLNRLKVYALPSLGDEFNRGFSLKLTIEYDFGNKKVKKVPLSRNIRMAVDDHPAGWGKDAWGGVDNPNTPEFDPSEWGGPSHELLVEKTVRLPAMKCRAFRLTLENDSDENILVSGMEISGTQVTQNVLKTGK